MKLKTSIIKRSSKVQDKILTMKKYIILAAAAMAIASCGNKNKDAENAAERPVDVKVAKAVSQVLPQEETYTATVESDVKNNVSPNMQYRIERVLVDVGDRVSKGQVVVKLDQANQQQLNLQLANQKAVVENAHTNFNRVAELFKVGGVSKAEYDNAKVQYDSQVTQLNVLKTQISQMSKNTQLVAPISGVVTARNYDDGDMYNGTPILTIEETSKVKILVGISESHYKEVKRGMKVDLELDAYPGEKFTGTVTIVSPNVDSSTHTFQTEVTINNQSQKVRPGMFARCTFNFGSKKHVVIPDEALVKQIGAGDRYVYVYNPSSQTVSYNKVDLGKHIGKSYEIFSGVNEGQEVVTAGQARLNNGKKVNVVK